MTRNPAGADERWVPRILLMLMLAPIWVWGGWRPDFAPVLGWISLAGALYLLVLPLLRRQPWRERGAGLATHLLGILCDPLLAFAGVLLCLLGLQWWNAWWPDHSHAEWFTGRAPYAGLPSAVAASEARLVFAGFAHAAVVALLVRHGLSSLAGIRSLFRLLLVNAVLLALFGLLQYFSGTDSMYWIAPRSRHFFASFYYENHAGQFFYMMFGLGAGYIAYLLCRRDIVLNRQALVRSAVVICTLFLGAVFSLSRTSMIFVSALFLFMVFRIVRNLRGKVPATTRVYLTTSLIAVCILGLVLVSGAVSRDIRQDFTKRQKGHGLVEQAYHARLWRWQAAYRMWQQAPIVGVGSYGFRYFLPYYAPAESLDKLAGDAAGNVHSDPIYFLSEHGLIGGAAILGLFISLLWTIFSRLSFLKHELILFPMLGVSCVLFHSLFDLPFRCPAVLSTWFLLAAACGQVAKLTEARRLREALQSHRPSAQAREREDQ